MTKEELKEQDIRLNKLCFDYQEKEKRIEEIEEKISVLLSCKNCPENKGGLICQKEYENKCLTQKIQFIKELQKENAELREALKNDKVCKCSHYLNFKDLEKENAELREENQKWKDGIALKDEEIGCIETDFNTFKSKAKDHIKKLLGCLQQDTNDPQTNYYVCQYMDKAEQFLNSEVEK